MSDEAPPVRCGDATTWRHKGEKIDLSHLLELIEENGGPEGLDLHGADLSDLDTRPQALRPYVQEYREQHEPHAKPPWLRIGGEGGIDLAGAHLESAVLHNAQLAHASLWAARLDSAAAWATHLEHADLAFVHAEDADLLGAHLQNANLWGARLNHARLAFAHVQNADLRDAQLYGVLWYSARLDRTRLHRQQLGRMTGDQLTARGQIRHFPATFHDAREAYLSLKTNFDSIGRYEDASWAFVKERQMEKAMYFPTTAGHGWIRDRMAGAVPPPWWGPRCLPRWIRWKLRSTFYHTRLFFPFPGLCPREVREQMARRSQDEEAWHEWLNRPRWLRNWLYEATTQYGENPWRPVIWAGVVVLVFGLIYAAAGNIATGDVGALQGQPTHNPWTALVHSISAFATIGFNTLEPQGWGARLLTAVEAMLGIGLFALFVFTLGNRMRRS